MRSAALGGLTISATLSGNRSHHLQNVSDALWQVTHVP